MSTALTLALISTLTLLALMISFLFGSAPMLFLKHATPVDSHVVRGAFNTYYWVVLVVATARLVAGEPTPEPGEHDEVRWLSPDELDDVDWLDSDRPFLAEIRRILAG